MGETVPALSADGDRLNGCILTTTDMVETRGYTLEEIAIAFDGPSASLTNLRLIDPERADSGDDNKARDGDDGK